MQYHTFATLPSKVCTKKIPKVSEFLLSSRHHSCTSVAVPALPTCNLSVHSYLGKPPRSHTKKSLGDFKMSAKWIQTAMEISITPQIRLCFVPFFSFLLISVFCIPSSFSIFLCVVSCHIWCLFSESLFSSPCFSLKDPTAPLGLSNSTRSFSPDSMLPGSCPEPSCNKHTIRETNVTNLAPRALTTSQRKGLVMWDTSRILMNQNS